MKQRLCLQMFAEDAANVANDAKAGDTPAAEATADAPDKKTAGSDSQAKQTGKTYSDADVDKIIEKKFAEWQKKQEKAVSEAAKLAEMNAQEKAEYERDQLQRELDALKKQNSLAIVQLLESDCERVRVYIAYFCVEQNLYLETSADVLRDIMKHSDDKMHRHYAHMALKQHLNEEYRWY